MSPLGFPKPKDRKREPAPAVQTYEDGREVCADTAAGKAEYKRRTKLMWQRQNGRCCLCGLPMEQKDATFEHAQGRGMGGAKRDDRIEVDGKRMNGAAHIRCNNEKGSRRVAYLYQ